MLSLQQIKDACTMQAKVRNCEVEGQILPFEGAITRLVFLGIMEYDEGVECIKLLGKTEERALQLIQKIWV